MLNPYYSKQFKKDLKKILRGGKDEKKIKTMKVTYDSKTDILNIRFDQKKQSLINKRVNENMVLDVGKGSKIVGFEILNASFNVKLGEILPISQKVA